MTDELTLNMELWNQVCKTDPRHTKEVGFGRKFTAIDAHYQIQSATEKFGAFGIGWGTQDSKFEVLYVDPNDAHYNLLQYTGKIWYEWKGKRGLVEITADIELFEDTKNGWRRVEDSHKKVRTDAITKGLSYIGFNADVFLNKFSDSKYVSRLTQEFTAAEDTEAAKKRLEETAALNQLKAQLIKEGHTQEELERVEKNLKDYAKLNKVYLNILNLHKLEKLTVEKPKMAEKIKAELDSIGVSFTYAISSQNPATLLPVEKLAEILLIK